MSWRMPSETAAHERTWMAFPRVGETLGATDAERELGYAAWADVANVVAEFEPVSMVVDPTEILRARRMLASSIERDRRNTEPDRHVRIGARRICERRCASIPPEPQGGRGRTDSN